MCSSLSTVHASIFLLAIDGLCLENVLLDCTPTDTPRHPHRHGRHRQVSSEAIRSSDTEKIDINPQHHKTHNHLLYVVPFSVWALRPYVWRIPCLELCPLPTAPHSSPPSRSQRHNKKPCFFSTSAPLHPIIRRGMFFSTSWCPPFSPIYGM